MRYLSIFFIAAISSLIILTSCGNSREIPKVVSLLKSSVEIDQEYLVNPLDFLQTEITIPGSTFTYKRGDIDEFQNGISRLDETEETFEKVDSLTFLDRIASIPETMDPKLEGKIRVNKDYDPKHVNIYFLNSRIAPDTLRGACAYVGYGGIILCDGDSLTEIIESLVARDEFLQLLIYDASKGRALRKDEMDEETLNTSHAYITGGFLSWILAHEIGHYIYDYDDVERRKYVAHFENKDLLSAKEVRADEFAAKSMERSHLGSTITGISLMEFMAVRLSEFAPSSKSLTKEQADLLHRGQLPEIFSLKLSSTRDSRLLIRAASVSSIFSQSENFGDGGFSEQVLSSVTVSGSFISTVIHFSPYLILTSTTALGIYLLSKK